MRYLSKILAESAITQTVSGGSYVHIMQGAGTNSIMTKWSNTGGTYIVGVASSTGGGLLGSSTTAYSFGIVTESTRNIVLGTNNIARVTIDGTTGGVTMSSTLGVTGAVTFSSTLAVTGLATITGGITSGGNIQLPDGYDLSWGGVYGSNKPLISATDGTGIRFFPDGALSGATLILASNGVATFSSTVSSTQFISSGDFQTTANAYIYSSSGAGSVVGAGFLLNGTSSIIQAKVNDTFVVNFTTSSFDVLTASTFSSTLGVSGHITTGAGVTIATGNNLTWGGTYGANIPTITASTGSGVVFYPTGSTGGALFVMSPTGTFNTNGGTIFAKTSGTESSNYQFNAITMGYDSVNALGWITVGGAAARTELYLNKGGGLVYTGSNLSIGGELKFHDVYSSSTGETFIGRDSSNTLVYVSGGATYSHSFANATGGTILNLNNNLSLNAYGNVFISGYVKQNTTNTDLRISANGTGYLDLNFSGGSSGVRISDGGGSAIVASINSSTGLSLGVIIADSSSYADGKFLVASSIGQVKYLSAANMVIAIGAAPITGGSGYIRNGTSAQTADFNITGDGKIQGKTYFGDSGAYAESVLVGSIYKVRIVDSAGNKYIL